MKRPRVLLFTWNVEGHHGHYLERFSEALAEVADPVIAAPDSLIDRVAEPLGGFVRLGDPRPPWDANSRLGPQRRRLADRELKLLRTAIVTANADRAVHLFADPVIRRFLFQRKMPSPVTVCMFFPRAHYPKTYGTRLAARERATAWLYERVLALWRLRPDARSVFALDEGAARNWRRKRGAPAMWLPEPPVPSLAAIPSADERSGFVLYGALRPQKGVELVVAALESGPVDDVQLLLAGTAASAEYQARLETWITDLRRHGVDAELRVRRHSEAEGLELLADARCALMPYPQHDGMSRTLLEAASVGTPVIVHDRGLLGHLVRTYELGLAVDCKDPAALRRAIDTMKTPQDWPQLAGFAARFSPTAFNSRIREAVLAPRESLSRD